MIRSSPYRHQISKHQISLFEPCFEKNAWAGPPSDNIYAGIAGWLSDTGKPRIGIALINSTYLLDFSNIDIADQDSFLPSLAICESIITELDSYSRMHMEKIVGAAIPQELDKRIPNLCSRLWKELDIIPLVLDEYNGPRQQSDRGSYATFLGWKEKHVDEQADSMARKCVRFFGVGNVPHLEVGSAGMVEVDVSFHMHVASIADFKSTVTLQTWSLAQRYAEDLKKRNVKISFFSSTPLGRAIAYTRSSLIRYVPTPSPRVSHIFKKIQKIIEGLSDPGEHLTTDGKVQILDWVYENANQHSESYIRAVE